VTRRAASWLLVMVVAVSALVVAAVDEGEPKTNADRAYSLAKDFACPVCQGQSIAESDVPIARTIRRNIRIWVDEGQSHAFIRDELVSIYGEDIDYSPSTEGISSLVWILPIVGFVAAAAGLTIVFRRWKAEAVSEATAADEAIVTAARRERHDD
jgi:cytochrome c-type biogenesis protein CcmH